MSLSFTFSFIIFSFKLPKYFLFIIISFKTFNSLYYVYSKVTPNYPSFKVNHKELHVFHICFTVCPYTFISLILRSIMIKQGLSPQPPFRWVMGLEPNGIWLTSPAFLLKLYNATTSLCHFSPPFSQTQPLGHSPHLVGKQSLPHEPDR